MANMLIRTRHGECKARVALGVRVVLFFGIPLTYFVFSYAALIVPRHGNLHTDLAVSNKDNPTGRSLLGLVESGANCTPAAILEFPPDGLTHQQRREGYILIHCVVVLYCFVLLSVVCEQYFVPAIGVICERISIPSDVAGATFMAAASSSPELFINIVGTFVTQGDMGVGAVVGSAVFNVLAVPACCALFTAAAVELDWWAVSRDCLMYAVSVVALILTLLDDVVYWHEALALVLMYTFYIIAMVYNSRLGSLARSGCCLPGKPGAYTEVTPLLNDDVVRNKKHPLEASGRMTHSALVTDVEKAELMKSHDSLASDVSSVSSLWSWPEKASTLKVLQWALTWPVALVLWATVPDCQRRPRLFGLTFAMCIVWIGGVSYVVAWIITILGDTLAVPDSITGLTILAAGTSLPEAVSSVVVTQQGHGTMGVSNAIGSNTFDILLCLGLPWLVKSLFFPATPGSHWVAINSSGLAYSAVSLLATLLTMYGCLALSRFQLTWRVGLVFAVTYAAFVVSAALIELNVFFLVNLPVCPH